MDFTKIFFIFVTLIGRTCSKQIIIPNDTDGLAELEDAAIQILTTCYAKHDKTIVILGENYENFMTKLSSHQSFSLLLLDARRRAENNINHWDDNSNDDWNKRNINRRHKAYIVVTMVETPLRFTEMLTTFLRSPYYNTEGSLLTLGWSSKNKYASCSGQLQTFLMLQTANVNNFLNANFLCRDRTKGLVLYGFHPFSNRAPEPWRFVKSVSLATGMHDLSYFVREYRKHEEMCKNLNFEKTHDLDGSPITTVETCALGLVCAGKRSLREIKNQIWIEEKRRHDFIGNFINYVNGTRKYVWHHPVKGNPVYETRSGILTTPFLMMARIDRWSFTYPHGRDCIFLVSQFRGNKTQLEKMFAVIDHNSWIGIGIVYFITLIFFKYFLLQSLIEGIVNLVRLSSGGGLMVEPLNVSSRIYMGCVFFFMITMQGIIFGNLAALLTHDFPVRQVRLIKDLADLNYTVYASIIHFSYFEDSVFEGHVIEKVAHENCIKHVKRDPSIACLTWGSHDTVEAVESNLYLSPDCIVEIYTVTIFQWQWFLEDKLNKFLGMLSNGGIMIDLEALVYEKMLLEKQSIVIKVEPTIMNLNNLGFAFVFLGFGLGCAFITFMAEIMIYRFQRRVTSTRVIVIN